MGRHRHRPLGLVARHHRRPRLPRAHPPGLLLRRGQGPRSGSSASGRAASPSSARSSAARSACHRLPHRPASASGLRRRARPRPAVAQALGRLGNWFNQELFGLPTDLPWGLEIDRPTRRSRPASARTLFHPTFLYEMIWNIAGALIIVFLIENAVRITKTTPWPASLPKITEPLARRRGRQLVHRPVPAVPRAPDPPPAVAVGQGARPVPDLVRRRAAPGSSRSASTRARSFLGIRINVWGALAAIVLGIIIIVVQTRRHPGRRAVALRAGSRMEGPR